MDNMVGEVRKEERGVVQVDKREMKEVKVG